MTSSKEIIEKLYKNRRPKDFYRLVRENVIKRTKFLGKYLLKSNKPNFLIIGAQKSGTTSLHYYLSQHPLLVGTRPKEIHYFDRWINFGYDINWYERHFNHMFPKNKLFFETTPNYIYHESIAKQLALHYPNLKLILVLRNPIERAFSAWNMYHSFFISDKERFSRKSRIPHSPNPVHLYYYKNRNVFPSFKEAIELELDVIIKNGFEEPAILRRGLYAKQIKKYYKHFSREQILIIGFKDLVNDTETTLNKIYTFLDVPKYPMAKLNIEPRHARKHIASLSAEDQKFVENYFTEPNKELFQLIGEEIKW
ncbi:MAG: sulfotransferase family protein [Bacteroidota bacterium]